MSFYSYTRRRASACFRPNGLFPALLYLGLGACAVPADHTAQAASNTQPDDAKPAEKYISRSERPATLPPGLERAPGTEQALPVTGEVPAELFDAIIADLVAQKNIRREEITVIRAESVIWPDGSLGCPQPAEMYTQAPVDGYWIVLRWSGKEFDYRATSKGWFLLCKNTVKVHRPVG